MQAPLLSDRSVGETMQFCLFKTARRAAQPISAAAFTTVGLSLFGTAHGTVLCGQTNNTLGDACAASTGVLYSYGGASPGFRSTDPLYHKFSGLTPGGQYSYDLGLVPDSNSAVYAANFVFFSGPTDGVTPLLSVSLSGSSLSSSGSMTLQGSDTVLTLVVTPLGYSFSHGEGYSFKVSAQVGPVPLPASTALLAAGLVACVAVSRRRQRG